MTKNSPKGISWINGEWGSSNQLKLPIDDRGLNLGDGIFETVLILNGQPQLLKQHLYRWERSANILQMATPPKEQWLRYLINEAINRAGIESSNGSLRINWSRGSSKNRGVNIYPNNLGLENHRFWLEIRAIEPYFNNISVIVSLHEKRNANSRLNQCKLFSYGQAIQAKYEANVNGFDEALLLSTTGEICCGTTANLIVKRSKQWLTPPLSSGCLPGIMRQQGLDKGLLKESIIEETPQKGDQWLLINSLSCQPIQSLNRNSLSTFPDSKDLWLSLLH